MTNALYYAEKLAALGHKRLGCTRAELVQVLTGCVREHHRFLLEQHRLAM
jgi:hypothetical protein